MKTLGEIKKKWPADIDWNWGEYEVYRHIETNNPKTYLLHIWDNNVWIYDVTEDSLSVIKTFSNKTLDEVKELLN